MHRIVACNHSANNFTFNLYYIMSALTTFFKSLCSRKYEKQTTSPDKAFSEVKFYFSVNKHGNAFFKNNSTLTKLP